MKSTTFVVQIPVHDEQKMADFQSSMNSVQDATFEYIRDLAGILKVSDKVASDVYYLRTRSRHTPWLENALIECHKLGRKVNVYEFDRQEAERLLEGRVVDNEECVRGRQSRERGEDLLESAGYDFKNGWLEFSMPQMNKE